jgi:hypothetical protein
MKMIINSEELTILKKLSLMEQAKRKLKNKIKPRIAKAKS